MFCRDLRMIVRGMVLFLAAELTTRQVTYGISASRVKPAAPRGAAVETANFRIYGLGSTTEASYVGDQLESLRIRLCRTWLGDRELRAWSPKCDVVVHATASSYLRAVGQDQSATIGASCTEVAGERVSRRRIDVRADRAGWFAAVVPHEVTHVILTEEFLGGELPHWADEGMATLADPSIKQSLHFRDLCVGQHHGTICRLAELIGRTCYPSTAQVRVFYGQSLSLVRFLVDRQTPADFVRFLHHAEKVGYDAALRDSYGLSGVADLERQWLQSLTTTNMPSNVFTIAAAARAKKVGALQP